MIKNTFFLILASFLILPAFAQDLTIKGIPVQTKQEARPAMAAVEETPVVEEALPPLWSRELQVTNGPESFDGIVHHAYTITIHEVDKDNMLAGIWKDKVKRKGSKVSTKKGIATAENVSMPEVHHDYLDVVVKFDENKGAQNVNISFAFLHDGREINPEDYPEEHEKVQEMLYDFSVELNRAVVTEQIDGHEKIQKDLEKDLDRLRKDNENLYKSIEKNERNLSKAISDQAMAERELEVAQSNVTEYQEKIGTSADDNSFKELSKLRKEVEKLERKIGNLADDQVKYQREIEDAKNAIPENEKQQELKQREIENQKVVIDRFRRKLADVR